ncbi:MAG: phosphatidylglycerol lysyltransferase domain-containing protein [Oscillospiraceae bacterium]|nr:phosphatidylglycerol lysyltransferase domain-containing protein [Oscillospiraceae bacterium]
MLEFRSMKIEDYSWMKKLQEVSEQTSCEYLPGNIYLWGDFYGTKICRLNDDFFATFSEMRRAYCFPVGDFRNCGKALEILEKDAKKRGIPLRLYGVLEHNRQLLEELYQQQFTFKRNPDLEDYVYNSDDLINLPGKKYHQKRNHIAAFLRTRQWEYISIGRDNLDKCADFQEEWYRANMAKNPESLAMENKVVMSALENFFALGFTGGVLYADGEVVGFTLGERINRDIFCTHIEKANSEIRGAYPMLNQQFAQHALLDYKLINREEDMGDEGLRRAKQSYHPAMQVTKFFGERNAAT